MVRMVGENKHYPIPKAQGQRPKAQGQRPKAKDQRPKAKDQKPGTEEIQVLRRKVVMIFKSPHDSVTIPQIPVPITFCGGRIRNVEFVSEIPKSPAGKTLRRVLKDRERLSLDNPG